MIEIELNIIDAGARYGLHPSWQEEKDIANFYLFEADTIEAQRLEKKYLINDNIKVYDIALSDNDAPLILKKYPAHHALSTTSNLDKEMIKKISHLVDEYDSYEEHEIQVTTLDDAITKPIHFLKLDVEGAEYKILKGATKHLESNILGIRSEVNFSRHFGETSIFEQVHSLMLNNNFHLLNLDYNGKGVAQSKYTTHDKFGYLFSTDAVWVKDIDAIKKDSLNDSEFVNNILRLSLFLINNNANDVALKLLIDLTEEYKDYLFKVTDTKLFKKIDIKIQYLFKELLTLPGFTYSDLNKTYKEIFFKSMKKNHEFYQSDDIN